MTTLEAQTFARALYDSLLRATQQQLRVAAEHLSDGDLSSVERKINEVLGPESSVTVRNFLLAMAKERALGSLPQVIEAFATLGGSAAAQPVDSEVTSAEELSAEQKERITADLRRRFGEQVVLRFTVDPSLIGGLIIRVGDRVIDNSLRTRLSALQRNMLAG